MLYTPEQLQQRGIYTITNTVTGWVYIGKTSDSFERRWFVHRSGLNNGKHHNKALQKDWKTYGPDAFIFSIAQEIDANDETDYFSAERQHIVACQEKTYNTAVRCIPPSEPNTISIRQLHLRLHILLADRNAERARAGLKPLSWRVVAMDTGIDRTRLHRFVSGGDHLTLTMLDALMQYFQLSDLNELLEYREEPKP